MRDEEERLVLREQGLHALVALLPEGRVADREDLVDEDDRLVEGRDHREAQPHLHARGEVAEGHLEPVTHLRTGEVDDLVEALIDLLAAEAVQPGREVDVLARGELTEEAAGELDERGDTAVDACLRPRPG